MINHLQANLPRDDWETLTDPRSPRGVRHRWSAIVCALMLGLITNQRTLADVVDFIEALPRRRRFGLSKVPSESTLWRAPQQLVVAELRTVLHRQVHKMQRNKQLAVLDNIGISLVAIDGKKLSSDPIAHHPQSQDLNKRPGGGPYQLKALRAVHVGSAVKPALDQHLLPAGEGESTHFIPFVRELLDVYGKSTLLEGFSFDAGLTSRANGHFLHDHHRGFIAAIKGDQPTLFEEAKRILGEGEAAPEGGWESIHEEKRGSRQVTVWFARSREMVDWHGWRCIRQVWRVRQRRIRGDQIEAEDRYFITNLVWGRLTARQCARCVRAHWGIENDSNWTLDVIWGEDQHAWVRKGLALETLSILRLIAVNLIRLFRHRRLRSDDNRHLPYRKIFKRIERALVTWGHPATGFG